MNRILEKAFNNIEHFEKVFKGANIEKITFELNSEDFETVSLIESDQPITLIQKRQIDFPLEGPRFVMFNVDGREIKFIENKSKLSF